MKRRHRHAGPSSSRGKSRRRRKERSDDEYFGATSSDSDYKVPSDEGGDFLNMLDDGAETAIELSDDDAHNASKGRKKRRRRSGEGHRRHPRDGEANENVVIEKEKSDNRRKGRKKKDKKEDKPVLMWEVLQEENKRWVTENSGKDIDLIDQNEMVQESAEPSDDLIIPLLRYQKEWLAWAMKQEESPVRGGILADEMGMGKTLQAIALVLLKRQMQGVYGHDISSSSASSSAELPVIKGTLVICPLVAVMQWVGEIERFTLKGSTKVLVYHGSNREKNQYKFSDYDFVITTYSIVEAEYRKLVMPPKDKCQYCGKLFYPNKLAIHLKYICGPNAVKTLKQSKQLKKESKSKKATVSEVNTSHVDKEKENWHSTDDQDVTNQSPSARKSILHSLAWNRIILDEAHYIKARRSSTTKAVLALKSSYKWALSGTPLQNRVGELYSLVRFLQVVPYSYYFCKDCDCRNLDYGTKVECSDCGHSNVRHFCWWNKYIASPIQDHGNTGFGRDAMILLKNKILKSLLLRRTKKGRAADLALPPRVVTLRRDSLDVVEEDYYTALYNESQAQFNTYIAAGTVLNNYAHIFDLLTRLRQAVDHPYLVEYSRTTMQRKVNTVDNVNDEKCSLCHDPEEDTVVTSCGHVFCKQCLLDFSATLGQNSCPSCSKPLTVDFTSNEDKKERASKTTIKGFRASSILNRIQLDCFQTSTKIDALKEEIRSMVERDGSAKGIVFSQFSSFLDLIHYSLQKSGVNCVQLDGSMTMGAREAAIKKFTEDADCRIFLMSLKAGGVALNLTVASNVFLMDPWWNPAVERQAQDRIHRIGQYKPITIVRFVIENTIEERILKLQEKKELVFEGTVGGSSEALAKLTEADLKFLFVT